MVRMERAVLLASLGLVLGCGGGGGGGGDGGGGDDVTADGWTVDQVAAGNFANGEINAAASPAGALHVSAYLFNTGLYHATDASGAWAGAVRAPEVAGTVTGFLNDVAVDPQGKVHLVTSSDATPTSSEPSLLYVTDRSGAWATSTLFPGSTASTSIQADASGTLHVAFDDADTSRLRYASRPAAGGWSAPVELGSEWISSSADLALDASGRPAIAYEHSGYGTLELFRYGTSWEWTLLEGSRTDYSDTGWTPALAIDSGGGLHVVFWDSVTEEVKYSNGTPGAAIVLAPSTVWARPAVTVDGQGRVHAFWVNAAAKVVWARKAAGAWTVTETSLGAHGPDLATIVTGSTLHLFYSDLPAGNLEHASRPL